MHDTKNPSSTNLFSPSSSTANNYGPQSHLHHQHVPLPSTTPHPPLPLPQPTQSPYLLQITRQHIQPSRLPHNTATKIPQATTPTPTPTPTPNPNPQPHIHNQPHPTCRKTLSGRHLNRAIPQAIRPIYRRPSGAIGRNARGEGGCGCGIFCPFTPFPPSYPILSSHTHIHIAKTSLR